MDDIKALVAQNSINLPPERVASIQNMVARGSVSYLSPDKEAAPFMLYLTGESLEGVAKKTNYPVDVIYITAMRYQWADKAKNLEQDKLAALTDIQHDIIKSLAVATHVVLQKQLADIIAGRADPRDCPLLPKNIHGLEKLMNMVEALKPKDSESGKPSTASVNLNINLGSGKPGDDAEVIDIPRSKLPPGGI